MERWKLGVIAAVFVAIIIILAIIFSPSSSPPAGTTTTSKSDIKREDKALEYLKKFDNDKKIQEQIKDIIALMQKKTGCTMVESEFVLTSNLYKLYVAKYFPETDEDANDLITILAFITQKKAKYDAVNNTISGALIDDMKKYKDIIPTNSLIINDAPYADFRNFAIKSTRAMFNEAMFKKMNPTIKDYSADLKMIHTMLDSLTCPLKSKK